MATDLSVLLVLVLICCFSRCFTESRKDLRTKENVIQLGRAVPHPNTIDPSQVTELSWRPRVFLYKGFLSYDECDHLISLGNDKKEKSSGNNSSKVVGQTTNLDVSLEIEDEITERIEERVSAWTFLPKGNGKPIHVVHIGDEESSSSKGKQKYMRSNTNTNTNTGEILQATVVMYLSNVSQGGHIVFPQAEWKVKSKIWWGDGDGDCMKRSEISKPVKGNAILFFSLHPNTSLDPSSSHVARCPIINKGDMWWATKSFVVKANSNSNSKGKVKDKDKDEDDLSCTDEDESCPQWASFGECERNPIYMVGTPDYYGTCRKSCNVCS
ncbi:probable prolyl 4-hydroxylase 12 [Lactuca sativa]|uniref:probable prolyl 4-hydroxylase 12 n=1 Tax=Lactuca sativa TaxID=4236 RepID=UPI000CB83B60|nr:probable prolyl 4-hydroxylase 12 [Lactuca sativa]